MTVQIRPRASKGVAWTGGARIVQQVIRLTTLIVLARLLSPEDFGLVAMVTVLTGFAVSLVEVGMVTALVSIENLRQSHQDAAFTANLVLGVLLSAVFVAGSPVVARFYGAPEIAPLTAVLGLQFVAVALETVPLATLQRRLAMRPIALVESVVALAAAPAGILAAVTGMAEWSLVVYYLTARVGTAAGYWLAARPPVSLRLRFQPLRELWSIAGGVAGFGAVNYVGRAADDLLIGRFLGADPLGLYTRAYDLLLLPVSEVQGVLGRVMFPSLVMLRDDHARLRRAYLRAVGVIMTVTGPLMGGLFVVAPEFVVGVLGPQWSAAIPIVQIFALVGLIQSVGTSTGWLYQTTGQTGLMFRWGSISTVFTIVAFIIGLRWGIVGVAAAYALRTAVNFPVNVALAGGLVGIRIRDVLRAMLPPLGMSFAMVLGLEAVQMLVTAFLSPLVRLGVLTAFGALLYVSFAVATRPSGIRDLMTVLEDLRRETV